MIAFHKLKGSSSRHLVTLQIWIHSRDKEGVGWGAILMESRRRGRSVSACPSLSWGLNPEVELTLICSTDIALLTVHTSAGTVFERPWRNTCVLFCSGTKAPQSCMWLRSCGCFGLCLPPISISAVSLKPSCIMHHLWLCGGRWRSGGGIAPGLPFSEWINGGLL